MKKLIATAALSFVALPVWAVEYPYVGVDVLQLTATYQASGTEGDVSPTAARIRFGSAFTEHLGGEAHVVIGAGGDEAVVGPNSWDLSLDGAYSVNLVASTGQGGGASAYAYVGYGIAQYSGECSGPSCGSLGYGDLSVDADGVTFGAGIEAKVWREWRVELDYASYLNDGDNELTAVGLGIRRNL